ncbi:D-alanyl-D-alanine carboxypeptidase/D-alanyl-D-alanine endopeptidase [Yinghuangia aomiensis]
MALAATLAGILVALLAVYAAGPWRDGYRVAEHHGEHRGTAEASAGGSAGGDSAPQGGIPGETRITPALLAPVEGNPTGPAPTDAGVQAALTPLLADPIFGGTGKVAVSVVDVASGRVLYSVDAGRAATPASTTKITTAVAALASLGADHRITTRVVAGADPGTIVLVGGGDPTLTALDGSQYAGQYAPARLDQLAAATAASLRRNGVTGVKLTYDVSLYSGPVSHPIGANENIAPVVPLMADEGRVTAKTVEAPSQRLTDPAGNAAQQFAQALAQQGIAVNGKPAAGQAPAGAAELGAVQSPPLTSVVEQMLTASDNDIAEALIRQIALAKGQPASFDGGTAAVREVLTGLGVDLGAMDLKDGSGLNRNDRLPPAVLTRVLALAASADHPTLRPALTGMPIAGFTGTLQERFDENASRDAAGLVRAKTGSLTGVSTLAGIVRDKDGRLLAFAFLADRIPTSNNAENAREPLDAMAATLAGCGCGTPGT